MQRLILWQRERHLQTVIENTKIIGVQPFHAAEVMHRKIAEHRNRSALKRLKTDQREIRVFRAGFADNIVPVVTRMHCRAHGGIAEGIHAHAIGSEHPAAQRSKFIRIKHRRAHLRRLEIFLRSGNRFDDLALEQERIPRIHTRAEATHTCRCRVRVSDADELLRGGDACALFHGRFHIIQKIPRQHAAVHDDHCQLRLRVIEYNRPRGNARADLAHFPLPHPAIHQHGQLLRSRIRRMRSGPQGGSGGGGNTGK